MRRGRLALASAWVLLLVLLLAGVPGRTEDLLVVRIDRRQGVAVAADVIASLAPLVELRTAWIVLAPAEVVDRLRQAGVSLRVLDASDGAGVLSLVRSARDPAAAVGGGATTWAVEQDLWVVESRTALTLERLPGDASFSPLSAPLPIRPVFERTGSASAVLRQPVLAAAAPDSRIQALVSQVSTPNLAAVIRQLEAFQTRHWSTSNARAAALAIFDQFRAYGLQAQTEEFIYNGVPQLNVVATIPGRVSPDQILVVGAHYDSTSRQSPASSAPGADDNASGTAAVLELARVMAGQAFDFTVRFVAFGAEESGLNGSRYHATQARARGERVLAMLNLDMIAYVDRVPEDLDATANPDSAWLGDFFATTAAAYSTLPIASAVNASFRSSDHAPFWDQGYPALMLIEDNNPTATNPYYHTAGDRFEVLDVGFATTVAQATLATAAALAQPTGSPAPPTAVVARRAVASSLFSNVSTFVVEWRESPEAVAGYNVYHSSASHGSYVRLNGAPVRGTSFLHNQVFRGTSGSAPADAWFVVTAVDAAGRESNRSSEGRAQ